MGCCVGYLVFAVHALASRLLCLGDCDPVSATACPLRHSQVGLYPDHEALWSFRRGVVALCLALCPLDGVDGLGAVAGALGALRGTPCGAIDDASCERPGLHVTAAGGGGGLSPLSPDAVVEK
jgi:hypothetical protein